MLIEQAFISFFYKKVDPGIRKGGVDLFDDRCSKDDIADRGSLYDEDFFQLNIYLVFSQRLVQGCFQVG